MSDCCRCGNTMRTLSITVSQPLLLHLLILLSQPYTSPSSRIGKQCRVISCDVMSFWYFPFIEKASDWNLISIWVICDWFMITIGVGSTITHKKIHIRWPSRLYCESRLSSKRMSALLVLHNLLHHLLLSLAPILPHLAEEVTLHHHNKKCKVIRDVSLSV